MIILTDINYMDNLQNQNYNFSGTPDWTGTEPEPPSPSTFSRIKNTGSNYKYIFGLIVFVLFNLFLVNRFQNRTNTQSKAGQNQATLSLKPVKQTVPPEAMFQVWLTVDSPASSVQTELNYDPSLISITEELSINPAVLQMATVETTPVSEANMTGKLNITLKFNVADPGSLLNGTFRIASLKVTSKSTGLNTTSAISFNNAAQITGTDNLPFNVTSSGSSVIIASQ